MRTLNVFNFITLNGFFQAPGGDISWHRHDGEVSKFSDENSQRGSTLLFGRVTYQMMAAFWPTEMGKQRAPVTADGMNKSEKIVFSKTLKKADWQNTTLIKDDLVTTVRRLKTQEGSPMTILGSGSIVSQLTEAGLIDTYSFLIDPVALGDGTPVFKGITNKLDLELTSSHVFKSGIIHVTYTPLKS
ncbi:dihydrofolate reductase family protein [Puia sp. P3]|uniref:dihydrofolate reductase family protein n=1 Tax=Puia sp. P3 TaxID=3423952 RepID=UPI003D66C3C8